MLPSEAESLRELVRTLDDNTTFVDGPGIRDRAHEIDVADRPDGAGGRSRFVLAMAAVILILLAGGTLSGSFQRQSPVGVVEPAEGASATPNDNSQDNNAEADALADEVDAMVVDAPDSPIGPSTSILSAPTTASIAAAEVEPNAGPVDDSAGGSGVEDSTGGEPAGTTVPAPIEQVTDTTFADAAALAVEPIVEVEPRAQRAKQVYESFTSQTPEIVDARPNNTLYGFEDGSDWTMAGDGSVTHVAEGLGYTDPSGRYLITYPGALSVLPTERLHLSRPIEGTYDPADAYYVSFVINVATATYGDAFWSPTDPFNRGAFGVQQYGPLKFVNGPNSPVNIQPGTSYLLVGRISDGLAELWVNPDLVIPGPAHVTYAVESAPVPTAEFSFSRLGDGAYTLDEFRMGYTWRSVAPYGG